MLKEAIREAICQRIDIASRYLQSVYPRLTAEGF